ncbi:MAG: hypothetical protein ACOX6T_13340 [Myxococcales bacterium]|jgi:hypothetical protein
MRTYASTNPLFRSARLLSIALGLLVVFGASKALARPVVTVAGFTESGRRGHAAKARGRLVRALQDDGKVDLLPFAQVERLAKSRRVGGHALLKSTVLGKIAKDAGADVAVTGSVRRARGNYWLTVTIVGGTGRELWSKEVELAGGALSRDLASRFAAAIAAAAGVRSSPAPAVAPLVPPEDRSEPEADSGYREVEAQVEPEQPELVGLGMDVSDDRSRRSSGSEVEIVPFPDDEPRHGEPEPRAMDRSGPVAGPPIVDFSLSLTLTWRKYRWCPEVDDCDQPSPPTAGSAPLRYTTDAPYGGVLLKLDLFPLARNSTAALRGLGLGGGANFSPSIATAYPDPVTGELVDAASSQNRYWFEGIYRFYFGLGSVGSGWIGLRAGYTAYKFSIDENPIVPESDRGGFFATLDVALPLQSFLRVEARGSLVPIAPPGEKEIARYGANASGGGFSGAVGLTSDLGHPEWHLGLGAFFEFAHFGDRYVNYEGEHPEFGRSLEDYMGLSLGLKAMY